MIRIASQPTAAAMPTPAFPRPGMPTAFSEQVKLIEQWALDNRSDSKHDTWRFWMLKIPAIAVSASSGVFAYYKLDGVAVIAGAVASLCVLIDGLNPGGALRNVHLRAFNDLRSLEARMLSDWDVGSLRSNDLNLLAAKIIESAQKEKDRIQAYLNEAETSLAKPQKGGHA
jgi:hypothetical protein